MLCTYPRRTHSRRRWTSPSLLALASFLLIISGCVKPPVAEFIAYRSAFVEARRAGEDVLVQYAAARDSVLNMRTTPQKARFDRNASLPARADASANVDEVHEFMAGWDAFGQYNEFLASIIEGKEESEVQAIYGGFKSIAASLPKKAAEAVASATGPWGAVIDLAVDAADKQLRRMRFVAKLKEGGGIVQAILRMHSDNATFFYEAMQTANLSKYTLAANLMRGKAKNVGKRLADFNFGNDAEIAEEINAVLATLPTTESGYTINLDEINQGGAANTGDRAGLENARGEFDAASTRVAALTADLVADRDVLVNYRRLVDAAEEKIKKATIAAATGERSPPEIDDIRALVIEVRKALAAQNERR